MKKTFKLSVLFLCLLFVACSDDTPNEDDITPSATGRMVRADLGTNPNEIVALMANISKQMPIRSKGDPNPPLNVLTMQMKDNSFVPIKFYDKEGTQISPFITKLVAVPEKKWVVCYGAFDMDGEKTNIMILNMGSGDVYMPAPGSNHQVIDGRELFWNGLNAELYFGKRDVLFKLSVEGNDINIEEVYLGNREEPEIAYDFNCFFTENGAILQIDTWGEPFLTLPNKTPIDIKEKFDLKNIKSDLHPEGSYAIFQSTFGGTVIAFGGSDKKFYFYVCFEKTTDVLHEEPMSFALYQLNITHDDVSYKKITEKMIHCDITSPWATLPHGRENYSWANDVRNTTVILIEEYKTILEYTAGDTEFKAVNVNTQLYNELHRGNRTKSHFLTLKEDELLSRSLSDYSFERIAIPAGYDHKGIRTCSTSDNITIASVQFSSGRFGILNSTVQGNTSAFVPIDVVNGFVYLRLK